MKSNIRTSGVKGCFIYLFTWSAASVHKNSKHTAFEVNKTSLDPLGAKLLFFPPRSGSARIDSMDYRPPFFYLQNIGPEQIPALPYNYLLGSILVGFFSKQTLTYRLDLRRTAREK